MGTRHPEYDSALPGYGAFKPEDVEDAERREPAVDLKPYAEARGLEYLDRNNPVGFWGVVPDDGRMQFNVLRGTLAGGRHGVLLHKLFAVPVVWRNRRWIEDTAATVHALHFAPENRGGFKARRMLGLVPFVGSLSSQSPTDPRPAAAGVPTTVGACLVPEAATLPAFECVNFDESPLMEAMTRSTRIDLSAHGAPGTWIDARRGGWSGPDPAFVERLMATSFGDALRACAQRAYARLKVDHGQLSVTVDGYLSDPGELDRLGEAVSAAATGLASACEPLWEPRPFSQPLPELEWPDEMTTERGLSHEIAARYPPVPWVPAMREFAANHGCVAEDPLAYHRAFPALPVPGLAFAVLRFTPPGAAAGPDGGAAIGRMAWHAEQTIARFNTGRNAVLLPAAAGTSPTPAGGVRRPDLNLSYAIGDGVFSVWQRRDWNANGGLGEMDGLLRAALALGREEGLAA